MGINEVSALGFTSALVSSGPTFVFGSHLAFTIVLDRDHIPAMMVGKLAAGVLAIFVANYVYELRKKSNIKGE